MKIVQWNFDSISDDSYIEARNFESNNFIIKWVKEAIFVGSNRSLPPRNFQHEEWEQFKPGQNWSLSMYQMFIIETLIINFC